MNRHQYCTVFLEHVCSGEDIEKDKRQERRRSRRARQQRSSKQEDEDVQESAPWKAFSSYQRRMLVRLMDAPK